MLLRIGCRQFGAVGQEDIVYLIQIDNLVPNRKVNLCTIFHNDTGRVVSGLVSPAIKVSEGAKVLGSMVVGNQIPLQAAAEFTELEGCDGKCLQRIRTVLAPANARLQRRGTCQQLHLPVVAVDLIKGDGELPLPLGKDRVHYFLRLSYIGIDVFHIRELLVWSTPECPRSR